MELEEYKKSMEKRFDMKWPIVPGRYKVGNKNSPVAVCTMASVDIELPMNNIAIVGKCVTENVGIEKIVKNIISNPNIRFLICCGKISKGHFVDDALDCLVKNGIDENKRIMGAKGAMPVVKNLTEKEVERFRKQVKIICMQGEEDVSKILKKVNECIQTNPTPIEDSTIDIKPEKKPTARKIKAWHDEKDIKLEEHFFEIRLDRKKKKIVAECFTYPRKLECIITGDTAEDVILTIIREKLISDLGHASYLGRELQKAEIALNNGLDYEQDEDVSMIKKFNPKYNN